MVIFGSVRAGCDGRVGLPEGARGRETETRGCGRREGEKGRKLADESRSGSTRGKVVVRDQPSATAAIARLLLFLFLFLPFISLFLLFFPYLFLYSPSDRTLLVLLPSGSLLLLTSISLPLASPARTLCSLDVGDSLPERETRDVVRGCSMATFTATTQIVLTGNAPQESQEDG